MTYEEMGKLMTENNWVAWVNPHGLWAVGKEDEKGLGVLGLGRTIKDAVEMAARSTEVQHDTHGNSEN